jgi:hypothetical protein
MVMENNETWWFIRDFFSQHTRWIKVVSWLV